MALCYACCTACPWVPAPITEMWLTGTRVAGPPCEHIKGSASDRREFHDNRVASKESPLPQLEPPAIPEAFVSDGAPVHVREPRRARDGSGFHARGNSLES